MIFHSEILQQKFESMHIPDIITYKYVDLKINSCNRNCGHQFSIDALATAVLTNHTTENTITTTILTTEQQLLSYDPSLTTDPLLITDPFLITDPLRLNYRTTKILLFTMRNLHHNLQVFPRLAYFATEGSNYTGRHFLWEIYVFPTVS